MSLIKLLISKSNVGIEISGEFYLVTASLGVVHWTQSDTELPNNCSSFVSSYFVG